MKKYSALITGLIGSLFLLPVIFMLIKHFGELNTPILILTLLYVFALILGVIGALVSLNAPAAAAKVLAAATLFGAIGLLLNLFLLLSFEGSFVAQTSLGILFLALSAYLSGKHKL
jgi:hypothetical protein